MVVLKKGGSEGKSGRPPSPLMKQLFFLILFLLKIQQDPVWRINAWKYWIKIYHCQYLFDLDSYCEGCYLLRGDHNEYKEDICSSTLVMSSIALPPSTALQASSKGLKHYLTVDTNLNDDVRINAYQHGDSFFTHDAVIHSGSSEVTLQYPSGLIDTGEFRICVRSNNYDESACDTGYNSEAKRPAFIH